MSRHRVSASMPPIEVASVASLAYARIRALILDGDMEPGTRLHQVDLADQMGISRTPVREALRRLTGEGLVEFRDNRGFRVAEVPLTRIIRHLEVRLLLEPGCARLAASRATEEDFTAMQSAIDRQRRARTAVAVHDASRDFHVLLVAATGNPELSRVFDGLWVTEIGRRLLGSRRAVPDWQNTDADAHAAILAALRQRDEPLAAALMEEHVRDALRHWQPDTPKENA